MPRNSFERRLEQLVTGTFTKAFRSGVQPVELGRRLIREMERATQVGVRGTVAPNHFEVLISDDDADRFSEFRDSLVRELADMAKEHAKEHAYLFVGPVSVAVQTDPNWRQGDFAVEARIVDGGRSWHPTLSLAGGHRVEVTGDVATIGRMPDCTVQLSDPKSSRYHAEIRAEHDGYWLHDLQSTNGTQLNGTVVTTALLRDGDEIQIGESVIRYEAS